MTPDSKDRLGDKLRDREKAVEDKYFAEQDKAAVEKLKARAAREAADQARAAAHMRCPKCGEELAADTQHDVTFEVCPACEGIWLDKGELQLLAKGLGSSWLARYFGRRG